MGITLSIPLCVPRIYHYAYSVLIIVFTRYARGTHPFDLFLMPFDVSFSGPRIEPAILRCPLFFAPFPLPNPLYFPLPPTPPIYKTRLYKLNKAL